MERKERGERRENSMSKAWYPGIRELLVRTAMLLLCYFREASPSLIRWSWIFRSVLELPELRKV